MLLKLYNFWGIKSEGWRRIAIIGLPLFHYLIYLLRYEGIIGDTIRNIDELLWGNAFFTGSDRYIVALILSLILYPLLVKTISWAYYGFLEDSIQKKDS